MNSIPMIFILPLSKNVGASVNENKVRVIPLPKGVELLHNNTVFLVNFTSLILL